MAGPVEAPFRQAFDQAQTPYAARNALGILTTGGGGGAPTGAPYITSAADATLSNERVLTDTATVTWDFATAGQAKANASVDLSAYAPLASPTFTGDPKAPTPATGDNDTSIATTAFVKAQGYMTSGAGTITMPQGRLTLVSATPVMTTTQSAKTTLYYTPYLGNSVPIYDGSNFTMMTFSEISVATTDTSKNPAAIGASKVNDWFVWNDSGTIRISHGPDWTSDTARSAGTALTMVNGIYLNNAAITNGPASSRGTYVGTTRSNASNQLNWTLPDAAAGGTAGILGIWNAYNRVDCGGTCSDTTATWTYNSTTYRQRNASAGNQIAVICGLAEDQLTAISQQTAGAASDATLPIIAIGFNSTTVPSGIASQTTSVVSQISSTVASFKTTVLGYNTVYAIEANTAATSCTRYGSVAGPPTRNLAGLQVLFRM